MVMLLNLPLANPVLIALIFLFSGEGDGQSLPNISVWCCRVQFLLESGSQKETDHHHGPVCQPDTECCLPEKSRSQSHSTKDVHLRCCISSRCITGENIGAKTYRNPLNVSFLPKNIKLFGMWLFFNSPLEAKLVSLFGIQHLIYVNFLLTLSLF